MSIATISALDSQATTKRLATGPGDHAGIPLNGRYRRFGNDGGQRPSQRLGRRGSGDAVGGAAHVGAQKTSGSRRREALDITDRAGRQERDASLGHRARRRAPGARTRRRRGRERSCRADYGDDRSDLAKRDGNRSCRRATVHGVRAEETRSPARARRRAGLLLWIGALRRAQDGAGVASEGRLARVADATCSDRPVTTSSPARRCRRRSCQSGQADPVLRTASGSSVSEKSIRKRDPRKWARFVSKLLPPVMVDHGKILGM